MLQVVALVNFYGADVKDFVVKAIKSPEDLIAWIDYLKLFVARYGDEVVVNTPDENELLLFLMDPAYAGFKEDMIAKITTTGVDKFIKLLEDVNGIQAKKGVVKAANSDIARSFTAAIKALRDMEKGVDANAEIVEI